QRVGPGVAELGGVRLGADAKAVQYDQKYTFCHDGFSFVVAVCSCMAGRHRRKGCGSPAVSYYDMPIIPESRQKVKPFLPPSPHFAIRRGSRSILRFALAGG